MTEHGTNPSRQDFITTLSLAALAPLAAVAAQEPVANHAQIGRDLRTLLADRISAAYKQTNIAEGSTGPIKWTTAAEADSNLQNLCTAISNLAKQEGVTIDLKKSDSDIFRVNEYLKTHDLLMVVTSAANAKEPDKKMNVFNLYETKQGNYDELIGKALPEDLRGLLKGKSPAVIEFAKEITPKTIGAAKNPGIAGAFTASTPEVEPYIIFNKNSVPQITERFKSLGFNVTQEEVTHAILANETGHVVFGRGNPNLDSAKEIKIELKGQTYSVKSTLINEAYSDLFSLRLPLNIAATELYRISESSKSVPQYALTGTLLDIGIEAYETKYPETLNFALMKRDPAKFFSDLNPQDADKLRHEIITVYSENIGKMFKAIGEQTAKK